MPKQKNENHKSKIGGQALIEGIMMRGVYKSAMAIRTPDGEIDLEIWDTQKPDDKWKQFKKIPFVRGVFSMVISMVVGYRCLMKSAEKAGVDLEEEDEEPSRFEQWLEEKLGDKLVQVVTVIGAVLGVVLALGLFMFLPSLAVWGLDKLVALGAWKGLIEGLIKIAIFVGYLALVSRMKDIYRMLQYHGAEHKTIACFEAGEELTVENVRKQIRFHPRCGTSFLILVLIIGILVFSVVTWSNPVVRTLLKLALMPVVVGVAFELIQLAGRHDNWFTKIISWPGIQLQHLTTNEPDDSMIEVAIAAMKPCIPENLEDDRW